MKFVKTLLVVAALGAAFTAQAESNIASGAAPNLQASARLNFNVVIPRVLYLRVGTGTDFTPNTQVDTETFTAAAGNIGTGTAIAGVPAGFSARVLSTGGGISLAATGSGTGLTNPGLAVIPWTQISGTSVGALAVPAVGATNNLAAVNGVVAQSGTWSFSYANAATLAAGTYAGVVTYTATLP